MIRIRGLQAWVVVVTGLLALWRMAVPVLACGGRRDLYTARWVPWGDGCSAARAAVDLSATVAQVAFILIGGMGLIWALQMVRRGRGA